MGPGIRKSILPLRVVAFTFAVAACPTVALAANAPALLPSGTYTYAIAERGKAISSTTIVVSRAGGAVLIDEHASPMEATERTRRTLDPRTFATRLYSDDSDGRRIVTVTIVGNTATLQQESRTTRIVASPHAPFAVSDMFVGMMFHLPATLHAAKATHLTLAGLGFAGFKAEPLAAGPSRAPRPRNVPLRDAAVAITSGGGTGTLWYDPRTFVLDEFDIPAIRFAFIRTKPKR